MLKIKCYDKSGKEQREIVIKESLVPIPDRRLSVLESNHHICFKGTGVEYKTHFIQHCTNEYTVLKKLGEDDFLVQKQCFLNKTGIFMEPYQWYFDDFIGGCGSKELKMIDNQNMDLSGVQVLQYYKVPIVDNVETYIFKCEYSGCCDKEIKSHKNLKRLLKFCIESDYSCPYDKNLYADIDENGKIRDVADWFKSDTYVSKFGTLYSLLFSFFNSNSKEFLKLTKDFKDINKYGKIVIPYIVCGLLKNRNDVPNDSLFESEYTASVCNQLIEKYVISGIDCKKLGKTF